LSEYTGIQLSMTILKQVQLRWAGGFYADASRDHRDILDRLLAVDISISLQKDADRQKVDV
jgi:hypothetical protein